MHTWVRDENAKIEDMQNNNEFDFNLPAVEGGASAKPRIHFAGDSVCVSCEG